MRFTKDHEWVSLEGDIATVGITAYAAEQLGDVVFVEVPEVGKTVTAGDGLAVVESVKAASDVYAPISGEVVEANDALGDAPETVNAMPEAGGWFVSFHVLTKYVKVTFFDGLSLVPIPPGGTPKSGQGRWIDIYEGDELDEAQMTDWIRQAAALSGWAP